MSREITKDDKAAAARYLCAQAFGKPVADIMAEWEVLEAGEDGYCHPLWIILRDHRHEARKAALEEAAGIADAYSDMCDGSDDLQMQGVCQGYASAATAIRSAVGE